ncbi:hypothetical protein HELRODRAFT_180689 [Helobdella robusta]|uniref:Uncharacterized protein n=1 Tax=Helobdella robusta TaxID=6412 RepID=T1FG62_HELRO|nr:hypothetical protein HELRODRAFT_180689 [Helobdella robusta]ESN93599.1 hypothetical protein HELRODRAFT_180689 [Helobdella robusta]
MKLKLLTIFLLLNSFNFVSAQGNAGSLIGIIIGIIAGVVVIVLISLIFYFCYLKKRRLKDTGDERLTAQTTSQNQQSTYYNPNNYVSISHQNQQNNARSHSYNNDNNNNSSNNFTSTNARYNQPQTSQQLPSQPPPYSSIPNNNIHGNQRANIHYTETSGRHPVRESSSLGHDNPAFFNRSVSSFADFPSMSDILLTSSKMSIPAALMLENRGSQSNKFSEGERGDSIQSKQAVRHAYDNPRFSYSPEMKTMHNSTKHKINVKKGNRDVLNEHFETYSDSDSENVNFDPSENWLDADLSRRYINKNTNELDYYRPAKQSKNRVTSPSTASSSGENNFKSNKRSNNEASIHKTSNRRNVEADEMTSSIDAPKKIRTSNKIKKSKKKSDSSDSGAEVTLGEISMNTKGKDPNGTCKNKSFDNRHSKVSSDSGVEEGAFYDSKLNRIKNNSSKLKWAVVDESDVLSTISSNQLSTEV